MLLKSVIKYYLVLDLTCHQKEQENKYAGVAEVEDCGDGAGDAELGQIVNTVGK